MSIIENIKKNKGDDRIRIYWTGGAGFIMTCASLRIGIDVYLSDACRGENDMFKRLTLAPCTAEELELDYLISTHDHGDHFDVLSVPVMLERYKNMKMISPSSVIRYAQDMGLDTRRFVRLDRGMRFETDGMKLYAVTADHGEETPDAIGVILTIAGKRIFFAGDGTYHDNYEDYTMGEKGFDVMLVAINGQYGNPDAQQAADIARMLQPKTVIPCHYWMFKEHGGDPMSFVNACTQARISAKILAVGEEYVLED